MIKHIKNVIIDSLNRNIMMKNRIIWVNIHKKFIIPTLEGDAISYIQKLKKSKMHICK